MNPAGLGEIVARIWRRDHTLWNVDPVNISDRLGWLDVADHFRSQTGELRRIAAEAMDEGFTRTVLLGMGGSSLAAETMRAVLGVTGGGMELVVLDSTHPDAVARIDSEHDLRTTLFVVASKSGTTVETLSHLQYFYGRLQRGSHFLVITDPDSPLRSLAEGHGFRGAFLNPPDIGGRYSALSLFGLVPAALIGADIDQMLDAAMHMAKLCGADDDNPGAELGAFLARHATEGRDKAVVALPPTLEGLGPWIEQLVAESTGKDGRGIVPVIGEPVAGWGARSDDRVCIDYGVVGGDKAVPAFAVEPQHLGAEFFRWEFATAVAGHLLGVQPFDQPDVAGSKEATAQVLAEASGGSDPGFDDPATVLDPPPAYLSICAFVAPSPPNVALIQRVRARLSARTGVTVTAGFGPRYLHSTGQLHKGGPSGGVYLIVVDGFARGDDIAIPGRGLTFGTLIDAQALGDLRSLRERSRRVARIRLSDLEALAQ